MSSHETFTNSGGYPVMIRIRLKILNRRGQYLRYPGMPLVLYRETKKLSILYYIAQLIGTYWLIDNLDNRIDQLAVII